MTPPLPPPPPPDKLESQHTLYSLPNTIAYYSHNLSPPPTLSNERSPFENNYRTVLFFQVSDNVFPVTRIEESENDPST